MPKVLTEETIRNLRAEAESEIRHAEHTIAEWRKILADLDATSRVLATLSDEAPLRPSPTIISGAMSAAAAGKVTFAGGGPSFSVRNPFRHNTNKAFVWEALDTATNPWLNANEIQERVSNMKGDLVPMSSISPTLSEMKSEYLERKGMLVALKSRLNEDDFDALARAPGPNEREYDL